jgi:hypothetical protein
MIMPQIIASAPPIDGQPVEQFEEARARITAHSESNTSEGTP